MLSNPRIASARAKAKPYRMKDDAGLYIEVRPTGAKLWRYRYRIAGKENLYALGEYAEAPKVEGAAEAEARRAGGRFTLSEARAERDRARDMVRGGVHPAQHRKLEEVRRQHQNANIFRAIGAEWIEQNSPHWGDATRAKRERLLEREIYPAIGSLPVRQITSAHVLAILRRLEKTAPSFALLARQIIGAVFALAISTLRADADPVGPLRGAIKAPPTKHKTPLDARQIPAFFKALDAYNGGLPTKAALRLLWLTLTRTNEALRARWAEFDLEEAVWEIPGQRMKGRTIRPHVVPLQAQAVEVLRELRQHTGTGDYLFPNRSTARRPAAVTLLASALRTMGYAGKFSPHGIRATGSTALHEMGFNSDWIERQLAHKDRNETRASYNGAKYLDARRDMMRQWAEYLDALCAGRKVVPMRRAAA